MNPGTGNNNSASPGEEMTVTADSARVVALTGGRSDAEFQQWVTGLDEKRLLRCQWNYYGDMAFTWIGVTVRSVQLGPDQLVARADQDALIGASVHLNNAIMCDANPEGFNSTQVFAEALEMHAPAALQGPGSFISRPPDRATTRSLNWHRNVSYQGPFGLPHQGADGQYSSGAAGGASATFQCGIEVRAEDLEFDLGSARQLGRSRFKLLPEGHHSPAISALVQALRDGARGLILRYNLYLCAPKRSDTELAATFARGERALNPAEGRLIGTIAPWYDGEPSTGTLGRLLKPSGAFANPYRDGKPYSLGPAVAQHDRKSKRISIDLANSLPEDGPDGDKYNLGTVSLGVRAATRPNEDPAQNQSGIEWLGTIQNEQKSFLDRAGIYDLSYAHLGDKGSWLDDGGHELVLRTSLHGVLLYEPEYMLLSDCTCCYLDELPPKRSWTDRAVRRYLDRMPHAALRGTTDLWILRRGAPPPDPVHVTLEEWRETPTGYPGRYGVYRYPTLLKRDVVTLDAARQTIALEPSDGAGLHLFRFVPERNWPQDMNERTLAEHATGESLVELRVLPYDDYRSIRDDELTLELLHREVFRYYHLIMPAMSAAIDLTDPSIWQLPSAARYVLLTSSLRAWSSWQFMPRTRDLSRYRRDLLQRYCRKILRAHAQADA